MYLWRLWYAGADWCCYVIAKSRNKAKSIFHNYWKEGDFIDIRGEKYAEAEGHEEKILDDDCEELKQLGARYNTPEFYWGETMAEKIDLSKAKTCELVEELKKREGVTTKIAENNQQFSVLVDGPAIVFVVID